MKNAGFAGSVYASHSTRNGCLSKEKWNFRSHFGLFPIPILPGAVDMKETNLNISARIWRTGSSPAVSLRLANAFRNRTLQIYSAYALD